MVRVQNFILLYISVLMIISQTPLAKYLLFVSIPLFVILITKHLKINSFSFKKILFLNLIVLIALFSGVVHIYKDNLYYFTRDIMYFIQAPFFLIIGIYLYQEIRDFRKILKIIVISSFVVTLYKISYILFHPEIFLLSALKIRYAYDLSNGAAIITILILLYSRKVKYYLFNGKFEIIMLLISFLSIVISFSRTNYVLLIVIIFLPFLNKIKASLYVYFSLMIFITMLIFGRSFIHMDGGGVQGTDFMSKLEHSFQEMTIHDYNSRIEVINDWRGFEAHLGLQQYYKGNVLELFFGQGIGTIVYTPAWVFQGADTNLDILPFFHNGYITLLLKTGLFGFILFFSWLYILLKTSLRLLRTSHDNQQKLEGFILQASVFIILFQTLVVQGIFKTTTPVLLLVLIGISLQAYATRIKKALIP